ncbi:hypothetical protein RHGRI_015262 [Rhododendron griersonianum]|uniref:RHOMBOID-like protein n=1 Tax=Rhododendron griersonianum TaxID=479676 RepID=A0AAV6KD31_9ERIC|nr:hypothetical protein RHGRI_015262 [Rhododendron griersonianum]
MARKPPLKVQVSVNSRRGDNTIHPADVEAPPVPPPPAKRPVLMHPEFKQYLVKKWFPWLTISFVVANVVMFVVTMYVNDCPKNSGSCVAGFLHFLGRLEKMGALDVSKVVHRHQGWRLITCIWLHAGVFHLLANMLSLVIIGILLEQEFGFARIGLLYLIAGFGGSLLSALFIRSNISVGASGALFGLLGAMLSELLTNWTSYVNKVAALLTLVIIVVINLAMGILPHVDNFAHIGGFLSGFLLGFVLLIRPQFGWVSRGYVPPGHSTKPKFKIYQRILWIISLILLIVGLNDAPFVHMQPGRRATKSTLMPLLYYFPMVGVSVEM